MTTAKNKTTKTEGKTKKTAAVKKTIKVDLPELEEMFKAGVHFGHKTSRWNSKMQPYIFTCRNDIHIFDLEQTREKLKEALEFLKKLNEKKDKVVLFVGTKVPARELVRQAAAEVNMPYMVEKWIGGSLTNFEAISKRLSYFKDLEAKKKSGELQKYTKKERHDFDVELEKLGKKFGGIKEIKKLPDVLVIVDVHKEKGAVSEARVKNIPVIGLCDSDTDPNMIDWPIPCNDDATSALKVILGAIVKALK